MTSKKTGPSGPGDRSWIGRRYTLLRPYAATTTPRPDRPSLPRDRVALRAANIAGPGQARHERHPVAVQVQKRETTFGRNFGDGASQTAQPLFACYAGGRTASDHLSATARWEAKVLGLCPIRLRMRREKPPTWLGALWMLVCIGISLGTRRVARAFAYRR